MRFFRLFLYCAVIIGSMFVWELSRENILNFGFSKTDVASEDSGSEVESQNKEDFSKPRESSDESTKVEEKAEVEEEGTTSVGVSFEKGFADVVKGAMNSVVNVATMQVIKDEGPSDMMGEIFKGAPFEDLFKDFFGQRSSADKKERRATTLGSGFIVKVDKKHNKAYVVTNNHVIDKAKKIVLYLFDKAEIPAEIHAADQRSDIAVLVVDTKILGNKVNLLTSIKWGDSDKLNEGNWIIAIGNPFGLGCTVTSGIISSKARDLPMPGRGALSFIDDFIQHSASINSGNSGGPLLNVKGEVIGINNAILSVAGGNIGISFAIPSNLVKNAVEQLIEHKRTFRGWLGAEVQSVMAKQAESVGIDVGTNLNPMKVFGAFVARVVPKSPAEKAGIKRGDIIIEFAGQKIADKGGLTKIVGYTKIDSKVKAKIWRQNGDKGWSEVVLDVTVGDFEKALEQGSTGGDTASIGEVKESKEEGVVELGITISAIPEKMKTAVPEEFRENIVVTKVDEMSATFSFFGSVFLPGDIIVSANDIQVKSVSQFKKIIEEIKNNKRKDRPVPFVVVRGGSMVMLATALNFDKDKK